MEGAEKSPGMPILGEKDEYALLFLFSSAIDWQNLATYNRMVFRKLYAN